MIRVSQIQTARAFCAAPAAPAGGAWFARGRGCSLLAAIPFTILCASSAAAGDAVPVVDYTAAEHETWRQVRDALEPLHADLACREVRAAGREFELSSEHIPQFCDLNPRLNAATGFRPRS